MTATKLYLAYGSNLNLEQMAKRCPKARVVGSIMLENYRLCFCGSSGRAVATIEPYAGESVPCLIWEISESDEQALDYYEGYPNLYRKEEIEIELQGKPVSAMAYIMNVAGIYQHGPSDNYLNTIIEGYQEAGFSVKELESIAGHARFCDRLC